ncbi:hypothetical protein [Streptomyces clavuligerus]|uniref:Polymerase nucleotidyl transferase domain-containing protein n=1 Tax=Streptomyces clavuligerus TaxID=1901 RepID=E2Q752_STRCL|nr:hypothetical protein [Streptomyces clavuligerus]ANW21534.1 hypothetical protein BB341_26645 [Streptomyces clavuligerus]AXU16165.1 hypothetical protein D1794_27700 [Streptomyces clavuligerus]EFG05299.1 Hypothetical protein SCLAV_0223 [Streptomyces clavuligerus]MBY6306313.1 hypothetical protein [Streptomyces clavuligerus]QCS08944.1 hypothetical protein CRV15_27065 [Streptomyces clavuligerus]
MKTTSTGAVGFPDPATLSTRLDLFLEQRGMNRDAVLKEADQGVGTPLLAVAAGSVLTGFGNPRSDLDLLVLVESERLTRFPIQSHEHGTLIDVSIRRAESVRRSAAELAEEPWPRFAGVTEAAWNHRRRALNTTSRLALGLPLVVSPPWDDWYEGLRGPWLASAVEQWWTVEAHRLAQAARWLLDVRPPAAAVRAREAVAAALNARATAEGELYFLAKWVGEKLKVLGDTRGTALLRDTLSSPSPSPEQLRHWLASVDLLLGDAAPLHSVLRWSTGIGTTALDDRTVVDRWRLRALEIPPRDLPPGDGDAVVWSGPLGALPPAELMSLFAHDMLWLGVADPAPEAAV